MKFCSSAISLSVAAVFVAAFCCPAQNYSISTIAGQGLFLGDGGPAAGARFGSISAVALGPDGSLYIADSAYHQIRRMTPADTSLFSPEGPFAVSAATGGPQLQPCSIRLPRWPWIPAGVCTSAKAVIIAYAW